MTRIVDFPEQLLPNPDEYVKPGQAVPKKPSDQFKLKQRRHLQQRKKWWFKLKLGVRLALLPLLLVLWVLFPQLPFWRFNPALATITGTDAYVTTPMVQDFLSAYKGQSLLTLNPSTLSQTFMARYPLAYAAWFRRQVGGKLLVHINTQKPWAKLVECQADTCQTWGILTRRYEVLPINRLPQPLVNELVQPVNTAKPANLVASVEATKAGVDKDSAVKEGLDNPPDAPLLMVESPNQASWTQRPLARRQLALMLQQLNALPGMVLKKLNFTNPINLVAHFEVVNVDIAQNKKLDVQLGQLDDNLTAKRLPRLAHLVTTITKPSQDRIDRIDLRWDKEVAIHKTSTH